MRHTGFVAKLAALGLLAGIGLAQRGSNLYIVVLKDPPLAEVVGNRKGLLRKEAAEQLQGIVTRQQNTGELIRSTGAKIINSSHVLLNAIYVEASDEQAGQLKEVAGVDRVQRMAPLRRHINKALDLINARAAIAQSGGLSNAGAGVRIAILDTGIDQDHPAFRNFTSAPHRFSQVQSG